MQQYFYELVNHTKRELQADEILLYDLTGEHSNFIRLNQNKVRQAGSVTQNCLTIELIKGQRQVTGRCDLQQNQAQDTQRIAALLAQLREQLQHVPDDPYLNFSQSINCTEYCDNNFDIPAENQVLDQITSATHGLDLVGFWASGDIYLGFANSLGQYNWHQSTSFNFDWSCYQQTDKAVKKSYADTHWQPKRYHQLLATTREQLAVMAKPAKSISPGHYRVYLAPSALQEIIELITWGGFGLKSHRTSQTPLLKLSKQEQTLHPIITLIEDNTRPLTPGFTPSGFIKPDTITLIKKGHYQDCLVDPRSAKEYQATVNCSSEYPLSLSLAPGDIAANDILKTLDTGLYINNLWYCNFSDRNHCQITGMTRFACFWVENGKIQAPVSVMRFDESLYHMLGTNLIGLTTTTELLIDPSTYGQRSTHSSRLPGALIDDFQLTL